MKWFRVHKRAILIVVVLCVLGWLTNYLVVRYRGIRLSPEKFMEKVDWVGRPTSMTSYRFDGEKEGRIYIAAWKMYGFPKRFHYWTEVNKLTEEQRREIERRMAEEEREKAKRGEGKR